MSRDRSRRSGVAVNERLLRERDLERARELARMLTLGVAVLVPLLLHVWQQVAFVEAAYRVEALRAEQSRLERMLRETQLERASLESLDRIEREARRRLGMHRPPPEAVVAVRPELAGDAGSGQETATAPAGKEDR